jgi:hypothetical protein
MKSYLIVKNGAILLGILIGWILYRRFLKRTVLKNKVENG